MKDELGVLLVEETNGQFSVQLFASPAKAKEFFEQLNSKPGQPPFRATLISLDWLHRKLEASTRDLPLPPEDPSKRPDAWRLGEGPINFPKKAE